mgnify:CR=1 FL=1
MKSRPSRLPPSAARLACSVAIEIIIKLMKRSTHLSNYEIPIRKFLLGMSNKQEKFNMKQEFMM